MTRHTTRALLGGGALLVTAALALSGCGGGFDDDDAGEGDEGAITSSDDALTILIGSSGDAETDAVTEAVAAWSEESGVDAEVKVASDQPQELSQGFAAGDPPDLFYLAPEALAGYAGNGSLMPYGELLENKDDFYPVSHGELHVRGPALLRPEGLLDPRPRHQQGAVGCRGADRR